MRSMLWWNHARVSLLEPGVKIFWYKIYQDKEAELGAPLMDERIGFIGLGLMGKPMARHLLSAAFPLTVFNRSQPAIDELDRQSPQPASSPSPPPDTTALLIP